MSRNTRFVRSGTRSALQVVTSLIVTATMAWARPPGGNGGGGGSPPPNPEIVYVDRGIRVMNADGTNQKVILADKGQSSSRLPVWSPDGTQVAFTRWVNNAYGVWIMNANGSGLRLVTQTAWRPWSLDWSPVPAPDGRYRLVFDVYAPTQQSNAEVLTVNPDGSGLINLTDTPDVNEGYVTWSRDGSRILSGNQLLHLGLNGAGELAVTHSTPLPLDLIFPRWANHHDWVVGSVESGGKLRLAILNLETDPPQWNIVPTNSDGEERWASFSPNDDRLAFHRSGNSSILTVNLDGTGEQRLVSGLQLADPFWLRGIAAPSLTPIPEPAALSALALIPLLLACRKR